MRWVKAGMEKRARRETALLLNVSKCLDRKAFSSSASREQRFIHFVRSVSNEKVIHHIKVPDLTSRRSSLWMFLTYSTVKNSFSYGFARTPDGQSFSILPKIPPVGHPLRTTIQDACIRYAPALNEVRKAYLESHVKIDP